MTPIEAIVAAVGLLLLAVVLVLQLRGRGRSDSLVQQQLIELRTRLDALTSAQQEVPHSLAEGSAIQARSLAEVRERLAGIMEATRQLEAVGEAVADIRRLLNVPKLRGTLGEVWLEELLREVLPAGRYELQHQFRSGERVDAIIRLRDRIVPVDAKFPLEAYERMAQADGADRERERRAFRRSLRARVDEIATKYIRPEEGTYEFALMYVPAEGLYYEAVIRDAAEGERDVVRYAQSRRVFIVSPNTFYVYLVALAHGLRGLEVERRTGEILRALGALVQEFARFDEAFGLAGRHLNNATRQFAEAERAAGILGERVRRLGGESAGD